MKRVLILDQFVGPSPYYLQHHPMPFEALVQETHDHPKDFTLGLFGPPPVVLDVDEDFQPRLCTTVLCAGADGLAEVWRYNWDSSG